MFRNGKLFWGLLAVLAMFAALGTSSPLTTLEGYSSKQEDIMCPEETFSSFREAKEACDEVEGCKAKLVSRDPREFGCAQKSENVMCPEETFSTFGEAREACEEVEGCKAKLVSRGPEEFGCAQKKKPSRKCSLLRSKCRRCVCDGERPGERPGRRSRFIFARCRLCLFFSLREKCKLPKC